MVLIVLLLVLVTNDVRQHHFHKQKIYLLRFFPLIRPLFPLRKDYFHQSNTDLHAEIINCIQALWRHWSREPITILSAPSMFMSRFIRMDYHADRFSYHTSAAVHLSLQLHASAINGRSTVLSHRSTLQPPTHSKNHPPVITGSSACLTPLDLGLESILTLPACQFVLTRHLWLS